MNYDIDNNTVRALLRSCDMGNTLNGGRSQPNISTIVGKNDCTIIVNLPGIDINEVSVEIINGHLSIRYLYLLELSTGRLSVPKTLASVPVSSGVHENDIKVARESNQLKMTLSLNMIPDLSSTFDF